MLSMTGFGKAEIALDKLHVIVELRSLNSKYLDLTVKMPSFLKEIECLGSLSSHRISTPF